ncbi:MAG: glutathione S-transferase N-terminal domain-containing protein [Alphaproteobacteria bacterium]|nr:glutathione S-transferase N-terminal domain-containing protein [Alphaproteobacteria bacterium]
MTALPTDRLAPQHPDRLQLYSVNTPNGKKIGIALEELGVPYEAHTVHIGKGDQHRPEFLAINPNGKIPALIDPDGPGGEPLAIFESGAILFYLAEKYGKLIPADAAGRSRALQWTFFQAANVGPMFGQFGHFAMFAKGKTDSYGEERYKAEVIRLLGVLDRQLEGQDWLIGEYSIADIATVPWVGGISFYKAEEAVGLADFHNVVAWMERFNARPAVQRGLAVTPFT